MMRGSISEILAIIRSGKFTAFYEGVTIELPTGRSVVVKILNTSKSVRPKGLRFSAFSFRTEVVAGEFRGIGFGEAPTRLVALQKSIAEGVERALYKNLKGTAFGTENSNGWAAHIDHVRAFDSAINELVERDAILVHWLQKISMYEIDQSTWPKQILRWVRDELCFSTTFNRLRILVSTAGYKLTITTALLDSEGHAVLSHATADSMNEAFDRALAETCRIAQLALEAKNRNDTETRSTDTPEYHALYYAFHERLPEWIFGENTTWSTARQWWKTSTADFGSSIQEKIAPRFHSVASAPLTVGFATSECIQNLYFGRTGDAQLKGQINRSRLTSSTANEEIYLMPHCVP